MVDLSSLMILVYCLSKLYQLQDLATSMLELWNLMDTSVEEQQMFQNVTRNIAASEHELKEANLLSEDFINTVRSWLFVYLLKI